MSLARRAASSVASVPFFRARRAARRQYDDRELPRWTDTLVHIIASFSPFERRLFFAFLIIAAVAGAGIVWRANQSLLETVPARGGTIIEGVVGTPRFINPLLALSDAERDLTMLVYSGLMRATPDGALIEDLAKEYTISDDGLTYAFTLKKDLEWHDGEPLTSEDVVYTINRVQDPSLKSPRRASWEGVTVERVDKLTVRFTLQKPYSPFLENTTLGILPKHLWEPLSAEQFGFARFNSAPIGSGPYRVVNIQRNATGIPTRYDLAPFKQFALGEPYIENLRVRFFANEEDLLAALKGGAVHTVNAISPVAAEEIKHERHNILTYNLPRVFGVFFNQNENTDFTRRAVREALDAAISRGQIVADVLSGYGTPLDGPIPPGALGYEPRTENEYADEQTATGTPARIRKAQEMLAAAGWTLEEESGVRTKGSRVLSFSLATSDTEELRGTARIITETWSQIGARVNTRVYNTGELNQSVIRPRKYEALLFGEVIGRESDPFAFWHSSQRNDPGLNIAQYANIRVDQLLEEGRRTKDREDRVRIYREVAEEITSDHPAVFLYSPEFIYVVPRAVRGIRAGTITVPAERFLDIHNWHLRVDRVWPVFAQ